MNKDIKVAVTSRSFSRNQTLREELLSKYKYVTFNDQGLKLSDDSLIQFLFGHHKAITALERIDEHILSKLPELRVISKYGVGHDMIDFAALKNNNIKFGWTGGVNRRSVSELVISNAISLLRHIPLSNREALKGQWRQHIGRHLSNNIVGIIGCGFIGKDLVKLLQPFGCKILVNDIKSYDEFNKQYNIESVSKNELLSRSDIVTLHTPLDETTFNMLSAERLALMKPNAILINAARGGLLDEMALKEMLLKNKIGGAALDVFKIEPPEDKELLELPNFIVTSHIGGSSNEAILSMGRAAISGLDENN
jgi:phosphoglycerate dehydrogenase-like enzyme